MLATPEPTDAEAAIAALRSLIDSGTSGPGDRLPAERVLVGELGISRSMLRKALDALEREGLIWRHVGKGTFVADRSNGAHSNLDQLSRQLTPVRMIQARLCLEPAIAREAAIHASGDAIVRMRLAKTRATEASSWPDYETQDDLFHRSVAEAADNVLLLTLFDQLNKVRRAVALGNVVRSSSRPPRDHTSFTEHDRIAAAIEARDPHAAQEAMRRHVGSVAARLFGEV